MGGAATSSYEVRGTTIKGHWKALFALIGSKGLHVPPSRIVCLTEETVETLYLLGEQDRIVGISGYVEPPANEIGDNVRLEIGERQNERASGRGSCRCSLR
jgi:hypothetical protein